MRPDLDYLMRRRCDGEGRRGAIEFAAGLALYVTLFVAVVLFSSAPGYRAPEAKPPPAPAAKTKPKVEVVIRHGERGDDNDIVVRRGVAGLIVCNPSNPERR